MEQRNCVYVFLHLNMQPDDGLSFQNMWLKVIDQVDVFILDLS
jgi:hypothetical protein